MHNNLKKVKVFAVVLFLSGICLLSSVFSSYAAIPHLINYQGRLTDKAGKPLAGDHDITFRIYDTEAKDTGNLLWEEIYSSRLQGSSGLTIEKGIFSTSLGRLNNGNGQKRELKDLAFDKPYFLEIKVDDEVMSPRQQITSAGYAIRAEKAERLVDEPLSTARGGTGVTANANTANGVVILNTSGYIPPASVNANALKTATGEVSQSLSVSGILTLPGGEYGFYPQVKTTNSGRMVVRICGGANGASLNPGSTYVTICHIQGDGSGETGYVRQRYVTSSGEDSWIFLLIDKNTKDIVEAYQASDHPAYGNGGDFDKVPHPFTNYDKSEYEIVLLDKDTCTSLKLESEKTSKSLLTLINEDYRVNMRNEKKYTPLHSGKFLTDSIEGRQIQVKQMVSNIPDYIKVRGLIKK